MIITKDKIIFGPNDWTSGLNTQWDTTNLIEGAVIADATAFNPYKPYGVAAPGLGSTDVTNISTVTGRIVSGIPKYSTGGLTKAILLGDDSLIHELTFATNTITASGGTFPHTIDHGHASEAGQDIITYSIGSTRYAFYSFTDATDWDIGRYDFVTTFDDDYMSTVAASPLAAPYITGGLGYPHPMIVGADDVLYVGDRNYLHGFDGQVGANGTFYAAVLTLPSGYVITSFGKTENFLVIFAYREDRSDVDGSVLGDATAFFWDYLSLDPTKVLDLDDNYVNGGFTWKGTVGCFTTGRPTEFWAGSSDNKKSDLRIFNGEEFEAVASFDDAPPIYRGVDVVSNEIMWNTNGRIYSYGEKVKGGGFKFNNIAIASSGSEVGFLKTLTTTKQYWSTGNGVGGGFIYTDTGKYSSGSFQTIFAKPDFPIGQIGRIKAVEVYLYNKGTASQNALTLNLELIGGSTSEYTVISGVDVFTKNANIYWEDVNGAIFGNFIRAGIQVAWATGGSQTNAPTIDTVIIHFEPINV